MEASSCLQKIMPRISEADYLEMEENAAIRHEYVDGYIDLWNGKWFAVASHNNMTMNLGSALY